jgi:serine/threonine protein kinase
LPPSSPNAGRLALRGGQLVPTSLDVYCVLELCGQGDLFSLRGQLPEADGQRLLRQLLHATAALHAAGVWHRCARGGGRHARSAAAVAALRTADG